MSEIMVVEREKLFKNYGDFFEGFRREDDINFMERILLRHTFKERDDVECNFSLKQPIGYVTIINPQTGEVFVSQRSKEKDDYKEQRLGGTWSTSVGGHIELRDVRNRNPFYDSIERELQEEVIFSNGMPDLGSLELLGYLNSEIPQVSSAHIGLLHVVLTDSKTVSPRNKELAQGSLRKLDTIENFFARDDVAIENWTEYSIAPIVEYWRKLNDRL